MQSTSRETAALIVNALYAAIDNPEQCQHLLLGTQRIPEGPLPRENKVTANLAIQAFDKHVEYQLTAQLNGIACLARLCEQEVVHAPDWAPQRSGTPWYDIAEAKSTFQCAIGSFVAAFKVGHQSCNQS